jgi:hypothetical protein
MKKLLIFTLAFLVLLSSSGVMMNMHYCMGKFTGSSISLSYNSASNCTSCGMEKKANATKGCCHDSKTLLKNSTDQKLLNAEFRLTKSYPIVLFNNGYQFTELKFLSVNNNSFIVFSPPSIQRPLIFIRNCSFLI